MNKEQEAYLKGVAHSIEVYAETMKRCVQALQVHSLADMPVELIEVNFRDVTDSCQAIQQILSELLPNLPEEEFNPEMALARYRELEALLNLELFNRPDWQEQRAQGNYSWLRTNKHFIEQETLLHIIEENGYDIVERGDEETNGGATIYEIEKTEEE